MDKPTHTPAGALQVNGPLSPPLTPALNGDHSTDGILNGTHAGGPNGSLFHNTRPVSPDPSISSASSSNPISSASSSPRRPASTFTATSFADSQPPPSLPRKDSSPPIYTTQEPEYDHPAPPPPSSHRHGSQPSKKSKPRTYTDGRNEEQPSPRLSKPVELLRSAYDVVVIGSGYGGGVAASRMARTGDLSVCLLERGREKWPGEYPSGSLDAVGELHCSGVLAPGWTKGKAVEGGDPTGMFHLVLGRGQSAFVANGEFGFLSWLFSFNADRWMGDRSWWDEFD